MGKKKTTVGVTERELLERLRAMMTAAYGTVVPVGAAVDGAIKIAVASFDNATKQRSLHAAMTVWTLASQIGLPELNWQFDENGGRVLIRKDDDDPGKIMVLPELTEEDFEAELSRLGVIFNKVEGVEVPSQGAAE